MTIIQRDIPEVWVSKTGLQHSKLRVIRTSNYCSQKRTRYTKELTQYNENNKVNKKNKENRENKSKTMKTIRTIETIGNNREQ